ncbi:MAG: transglycosylase domain-containing protein [Psychroflexus sp.]|nr:transglycosylase domain-containing protein [Psychroflexus sp.]
MTSEKKSAYKKYIKIFWLLYAAGVLGVALLFLLASWGVFGEMPTFEELENPETNLATEVLSSDGKTIGKYFKENRTPVKYEDLPGNLVKALVSTEDERYYSHAGIDARGTVRAAVYLGKKGGASTISQQLAKLLFTKITSNNKLERIIQKFKEWVIAIRLERQYTKEEIITMYLNKFDFIYQADGIRSASRIYFGKEPKELELHESSVLVAMLKNPTLYNPLKENFKANAKERRNQVFEQMKRNEHLNEKEVDSLQQLALDTNYSPEQHDQGMATYFRAHLREYLQNWIKENPKPDGTEYSLYSDGIKVYTTIDSRYQQYAENAVNKHLKNLQKVFDEKNKYNSTAPFRDVTPEEIKKIINREIKNSDRYREMLAQGKSKEQIMASFDKKRKMKVFSWKGTIDTTMTPRDSIRYYKSFLNAGMMSMQPITGAIKAWVGGINYQYFKYEHVKQAERQVGSTFKPFVYATAIDQLNLSPCYQLPNTRFTIPKGKYGLLEDWSPDNAGNEYGGMKSLKQALAESINTITARVMDKTGPNAVIQMIDNLGVDTSDIPSYPSIALGTADLSVYEMVAAYSTFANKGVYTEPYFVSRIEDKNGSALYQHSPKTEDVLSKETAYVTTQLLEGVTKFGSGRRLRGTYAKNLPHYKKAVTGYPYDFENPIAGKTGTTQNQSDGWFIGMVPDLATGVWVGGQNRSVRFPSLLYGQGATMALPIWGKYMKDLYKDEDIEVSKEDFEKPDNLSIKVDCDNEDDGSDDEDDANGFDYQVDF